MANEVKDTMHEQVNPVEAATTEPKDSGETPEQVIARLQSELKARDERIAELEGIVSDKEEFDRKLIEAGDREPEVFDFIEDLSKGMPAMDAIAKNFDIENMKPMEGSPDYEGYQKATGEFKAKKAEREEAFKTIESNRQKSIEEFAAMMEELGAPEEKVDQFVSWWEAYNQDIQDGKLDKNRWKGLWKMCFHDEIIAEKDKEAESMVRDAEIAGRNAQIEKKRMKQETGDGIPRLSNTGSVKNTEKKKSFGDKFLDGVI